MKAPTTSPSSAATKRQFAKYQEHWYGDILEMENQNLRRAAQERLVAVREDFNALDPAFQNLQNAYSPFLQHLDDIRTYLANDTTTPAVNKMVPVFEQARQSAADLRTAMDQLLIQLKTFDEALRPATSGQVDGPAS